MRFTAKSIVWLCLLLTCWSVVALVTHHHSAGTESATCTVCMVAHATAPTQTTTVQVTFVLVSEPVSDVLPTRQHIEAFALQVRGPPAA